MFPFKEDFLFVTSELPDDSDYSCKLILLVAKLVIMQTSEGFRRQLGYSGENI